jgi:nucleotide-binding universal stress UspA family protein
MYENILVAVDGSKDSDAAFETAVDLAQKYKSKLFVIHVVHESTGRGTLVSHAESEALEDIGREIIDGYEKKIKEEKNFLNARMLLKKGDAAQRIVETAREENCNLIVLGRRGTGAFKELLLGSVSHKVVNHAECPVLVVR